MRAGLRRLIREARWPSGRRAQVHREDDEALGRDHGEAQMPVEADGPLVGGMDEEVQPHRTVLAQRAHQRVHQLPSQSLRLQPWQQVDVQVRGIILGELIRAYDVRGNLIPDAALAALAIEHGVALASTDTDFARFRELRWENPLV